MFYSQLSMLDTVFSRTLIDRWDNYLFSLSPQGKQIITISKVADALPCDYSTAADLIKKSKEIGFLKQKYALQCPNCGMLLLEGNDLNELLACGHYCAVCEEVISPDEFHADSDIVLLFSVVQQPTVPFPAGQRSTTTFADADVKTIAPVSIDSIAQGIHFKLVTYADLYAPSEQESAKLESLLALIETQQATTKQTGDTLENFIQYWFTRCQLFCATTEQRTESNQIDIMVRTNGLIDHPLFKRLGMYFYIECKNEKTVPKIDYLQKLQAILLDARMSFGILVSRKPEPKTYKKKAHDIFLQDDMIIIRLHLQEIKNIILSKKNLLEVLECKIAEIQTDAKKSLGNDGIKIYDA